jgi:hypothetical protein
MPRKGSTITRYDFDNAISLLDNLSPNGPLFRNLERRQIAFRGLGYESYELIPSALRSPAPTRREQYVNEFRDFLNFRDAIDAQGLSIPEDSFHTREMLRVTEQLIGPNSEVVRRKLRSYRDGGVARKRHATANKMEFDSEEFMMASAWQLMSLSALALAQHYGVKTELLDWTRSGTVAAYFAAISAVRDRTAFVHSADRIVVWVLRTDHHAVESRYISPELTKRRKMVLFVFEPPTAGIPNLRAQQGLFSYLSDFGMQKMKLDQPFSPHPLDKTLLSWGGSEALMQLTLPHTEAPKLLRLLHRQGVSAATLFPGFSGAAMIVEERKLWDQVRI